MCEGVARGREAWCSHHLLLTPLRREVLFDLDVTSYPELARIEQDMNVLQQVYDLYADYKAFEKTSGEMLWSALDASALLKGVEAIEHQARRSMSKAIRGTDIYKRVEERVLLFKDGVPLISALKNDAWQRRHWKRLMKLTGIQ